MGNGRNVEERREARGSWKRMKKSKEKERRKRKKRGRGKREKEKEEKRKREIEGKGIWREVKGRTFEGRRELIKDYAGCVFFREKDRDVRSMGKMREKGEKMLF